MKMCEFDYYFKMRSAKEVAFQMSVIYKNLGYSEIDKNKAFQTYGITIKDMDNREGIDAIINIVDAKHTEKSEKILELCRQLKERWLNYREEYLKILSKALDIEFDKEAVDYTYCYLHFLPINEIDIQQNIIFLDCNKDIDELFNNFIIMLTKAILLDRWHYFNKWKTDYEYDKSNKVWLFADIAVDAIFYNSPLNTISRNPSYKYFYSLKINGVNIMEEFRKLYKMICLEDFFTSINMFIYKNYEILSKFKNYLY